MKALKNKFENEIIKIIGNRTKDGNCLFCNKPLKCGEYCSCDEAEKKNLLFKKAYKMAVNYCEYEQFGDSVEEKAKEIKIFFKTPPLFSGMDFKDYKIECESEQKGLKTVEEYYKNAIENYIFGRNLVLVGGFGTGKTMLISILCNKLAEKWLFKNRFINAVDLKSEIINTFSASVSKSSLDVVNKYKNADWLFLDDIDKLTPTDYVKEFMYSIVNYRVENQLPTGVTSNHSLEELDRLFFGEAVVSRLVSQKSPVVIFTHKNRRFS